MKRKAQESDGSGLENRHRLDKSIVGSNPTPSAINDLRSITGMRMLRMTRAERREFTAQNSAQPLSIGMSDSEIVGRLREMFHGNEWRLHPDTRNYAVSDHGLVYSLKRHGSEGGIIKPSITYGYYRFVRHCNGRRINELVHRAVLLAFVGMPPPGHEAEHLNGDRLDNRLANLAWATHADNMKRKEEHGTVLRGSCLPRAKVNERIVAEMRARHAAGESPKALFAEYQISKACGQNIIYGRSWRHV